jgi:hypothetical protein
VARLERGPPLAPSVGHDDALALLLPVDLDPCGVGVVSVGNQLGEHGGGVAVEIDAEGLDHRQVGGHLVLVLSAGGRGQCV